MVPVQGPVSAGLEIKNPASHCVGCRPQLLLWMPIGYSVGQLMLLLVWASPFYFLLLSLAGDGGGGGGSLWKIPPRIRSGVFIAVSRGVSVFLDIALLLVGTDPGAPSPLY
jgi:hypothetical protein